MGGSGVARRLARCVQRTTKEEGILVVMQFGNIGFDPLRVPVAASGSNAASATFADRLEQASRQNEPSPPRDRVAAKDSSDSDEIVEPEVADARGSDESIPDDTDAVAVAEPSATEVETDASATVATNQELPSRESPTWRDDAGEGVGDSLDTFAARAPLSIPVVGQVGNPAAMLPGKAPAALGIAPLDAASAASSTSSAKDNRLPAAQLAAEFRSVAVEAKPTGYRTLNAAGVAMNDQARDSVFKQILFKLGKEGSEMRVRLEPPEFGELDLHMTVDSNNSLRLSIGTERADMRDLIQGGLDQLKKELQDSGLTVAHAEVHTRDGQDRQKDPGFGEARQQNSNGDDADDASNAKASRHTGWYSTSGLDFWV